MKEKYFKLIQLFVLVALCLQTTGYNLIIIIIILFHLILILILLSYCVCLSISKNILKETYSNYEVLGLSG